MRREDLIKDVEQYVKDNLNIAVYSTEFYGKYFEISTSKGVTKLIRQKFYDPVYCHTESATLDQLKPDIDKIIDRWENLSKGNQWAGCGYPLQILSRTHEKIAKNGFVLGGFGCFMRDGEKVYYTDDKYEFKLNY